MPPNPRPSIPEKKRDATSRFSFVGPRTKTSWRDSPAKKPPRKVAVKEREERDKKTQNRLQCLL